MFESGGSERVNLHAVKHGNNEAWVRAVWWFRPIVNYLMMASWALRLTTNDIKKLLFKLYFTNFKYN
jgi:hypothetical protein